MILPLFVSIIYVEGIRNVISFLIPIVILITSGLLLTLGKKKGLSIGAREGFVIVGLSWIIISFFGAFPFVISGEIDNFFDAFFEMTSGFTTTGASILDEPAELSHSMLFFRSFSHWIGGMGILVFILAVIPESKEGSSFHILRAESPGPSVGKLVSKMQVTSRILYLIYMGLSLLEFIVLLIIPDKNMGVFESFIYTFGTAGTGGFATTSNSFMNNYYSIASQYTVAVFMILFGINFSMFYLILIGNFKDVYKNEELRFYLITILVSVTIISFNIYHLYHNVEHTFRYSFFTVASIITTTGFSNVDYSVWPTFSLIIVIILTSFGACAGSTAGGIKSSRVLIITKYQGHKIKSMINPRRVETLYLDGKPIDKDILESVKAFIIAYVTILVFGALLISIYNPKFNDLDPITSITASLTCLSNVGPGLGKVGPTGNFSNFSSFSKVVLALEMIAGRLEIFPIFILFYPRTWRKRV